MIQSSTAWDGVALQVTMDGDLYEDERRVWPLSDAEHAVRVATWDAGGSGMARARQEAQERAIRRWRAAELAKGGASCDLAETVLKWVTTP